MMAAAANCFNFAGIANSSTSPSFHPFPPSTIDDIPNDPGKMFIGGLSWQTTPESIREYFSSFGELAEVMVMKDPATRRSRGFGFITFSDPRSVEDVLKYPVHQLDGKLVEPKVAVPRKTNPKLVMRTRKIFVGGLSATTSLEDIKAYFEQFSPVKEAMLAYDKITSRHRGFGFVTFDNEDVVDKICEIHFHEINGKMVESKKALPKEPRLAYYSNGYGSPSGGAPVGYGHFSPTTRHHGNPFGGTYGGGGGVGGAVASHGGQRYSQSYGQCGGGGGGGGYGDHRNDQQQQQDRQFLHQMGQFDNANFGYDGCDDARYYTSKYGGGGGGGGVGGVGGSSGLRQYATSDRSFYGKDYGSVGGSRINESPSFFGGSYRDGGRTYERVRSIGPAVVANNGNHGGGFGGGSGSSNNMLSNGYYSTSRDFAAASSNHHHHVGNNYSTSAGSSGGGSGENSAGYEDDFPELATAKFNSLRLDDDVSPTATTNSAHNDMNQNNLLVGGNGGVSSSAASAFVAF